MKYIIDIVLSVAILIIVFPLLIAVTLAILLLYGRPIFFTQNRPGLHGKPFKLIKFRSMRNGLDENSLLLPDSQRLTRLGCMLRKTSIDELPELWNVIKGDMSLVGPRPLLMEYLPLYNHEQVRRHEVRPGITGWAQVNGRNAISWEKKFKYDVWYVDNQSIFLDLKILIMTVFYVLSVHGITAEGNATVEKFQGNP